MSGFIPFIALVVVPLLVAAIKPDPVAKRHREAMDALYCSQGRKPERWWHW